MLTGYYDLAKCPPTYDVVSFLLALEQERIRRGDDAVEIEILPGPVGGFRDDNLWPRSIDARWHMLTKIVIPMCAMLPSCKHVNVPGVRVPGVRPSIGYNLYSMQFKNFVRAVGHGIRPLRPKTDHLLKPSLITLTLRECEHWPERNSRVEEWQKAADAICSMGYRVRIVRDARFDGALDLETRAKLYRSAACNMFVSNGPAWFAVALDAPVIIMRPATEGTHPLAGAANMRRNGIPIGGNIPGMPAHQRLVWEDDTVGNIVDACRAFMDDRKQQAA